jgi:hypothetical protein
MGKPLKTAISISTSLCCQLVGGFQSPDSYPLQSLQRGIGLLSLYSSLVYALWSNLQRDTSATAQRRLLKLKNMSGRHPQRLSGGLRVHGIKQLQLFNKSFILFLVA